MSRTELQQFLYDSATPAQKIWLDYEPCTADTTCPSCGLDQPIVFMLKDGVFESAGLPLGTQMAGYWCCECFERKLGRSIVRSDLQPEPPCNAYFFATLAQ